MSSHWQLQGSGRVEGLVVSATFSRMSRSIIKGFISQNQAYYLQYVYVHCLRMRGWTGRSLASWNGARKLLWFSTFKAALSALPTMPARFQALWILHTNWKSKSSSFGWVLRLLFRRSWPKKHFSLCQSLSIICVASAEIWGTGSANLSALQTETCLLCKPRLFAWLCHPLFRQNSNRL